MFRAHVILGKARATKGLFGFPAVAAMLAGGGIAMAPPLQEPPIRELGATVGRSTTPLRAIYGAREIGGGRVLVNEWGGKRLLLFDSTLSSVATVLDTSSIAKRRYVRGGQFLIGYSNGSSLFYDASAEGFLVISATGAIDRVIAPPPMDNPMMLMDVSAHADGVDATGRFVYRGLPRSTYTPSPDGVSMQIFTADSGALLAAAWAVRRIDTLATLKLNIDHLAAPVDVPKGEVANKVVVMNPLPSADDWVVTPTGAIAIVRTGSFRVEWLNEDGSKSVTPPLPIEWHRLTDSAKAAEIDSTRAVAEKKRVLTANSLTGKTISVVQPVPDAGSLPDYPPPFRPGTTLADADGNLWILPAATKDEYGKIYSIVNRRGAVTDRVRVPNGYSVAGFGHGMVYLTIRDGSTTVLVARHIR